MATPPDPERQPAQHAYVGLDRVLHEKARLGILTALLNRGDGATFVELKTLCALTDGNLNRHLAVLQDAGFVVVRKTREHGRIRTAVRMTAPGRRAFLSYLDELERVIRDARAAARPGAREENAGGDLGDGTSPADFAPA